MTLDQTLQVALGHHTAGRAEEAEKLYRQVLTQAPGHADALHLLGLLMKQKGQREAGIELIQKAIAAAPDRAGYHSNLGNILNDLGRSDEAIACYRRALALKPDHAEAHNNLGNALRAKGELDDAILSFQEAVRLRPDLAKAHANLAGIWAEKGKSTEAVVSYRRALELMPHDAELHNELANACYANAEHEQAEEHYHRALSLKPDYAQPCNNLGNLCKEKKDMDQAITWYQRALALDPQCPEIHFNLGIAWDEKKNLDQAIPFFRRAMELKPDWPEPHFNLGNVLKDKGLLDEAIACYRRALEIQPDCRAARDNLIFLLHYHPSSDRQSLFQAARNWHEHHGKPLASAIRPHANSCDPHRRLKIGYVSPDLRGHSVGRFLRPLLANHDHQQFEIFCYSLSGKTDVMTQLLRAQTDAWRSLVKLEDEEAAEMIRQDGIDILVDLAMHTAGNRLPLFVRKPAPVQVTYLAYAGGTGVEAIDYRLTDRYLDPDEADDRLYLEKSFRLQTTYWCYQLGFPGTVMPTVSALPALASGQITFGCLNNYCKVNAAVLETWAELMQAVSGSRLLLFCPEGDHRQTLRQFFRDRGIRDGRIELLAKLPGEDYFNVYRRMDIALDPFPYGGGTTTCDALWMGLPVITLADRTAAGRAGVSILSTLGHPEWIAQTPQEYVRIAAALAAQPRRLGELRLALRRQMESSLLMDGQKFARDVEGAYRTMWKTWCATDNATSQCTVRNTGSSQ